MTEPNKIEARGAGRRFRASDSHRFCKSTITRFPVDIHQEMRCREKEILQALGITPRADGGHRTCPYPDHPDRHPSWRWVPDKARWYCSCGSGSVVDAVARVEGLSDRDATAWIRAHLAGKTAAPRPAPVIKLQPRREEPDKRWQALEIWRSGIAIKGTPAELYLRGRGLDPDQMRHDPPGCGETLRWWARHRGSDEGALIAAINDRDSGLVVAVQRIFLHADGSAVLGPDGKKVKKALGAFAGHAARLSGWPDPEGQWGISEGIETALASQQFFGFPVWAAVSASNMANVLPPHWAQSAIVFADYDEGGEKAAMRSFEALKNVPALGKVKIVRATQLGSDMADVLVRRTCHG